MHSEDLSEQKHRVEEQMNGMQSLVNQLSQDLTFVTEDRDIFKA